MSSLPSRDRLLIRHFLWRLLEHDLISPQSDRRGVLSALAGGLMATGLFVAVLVAWPYQFFAAMPPGLTSLRSLDDRFLFVSASMLVMALAAVGQWDALMLDERDTAVLGPLPVSHWLIARSKFAATGMYALAVLVAWNVGPTLLRGAAVPVGLRLSWMAVLTLTLAHAVATCAAGLFGFLAVLGLREVGRALVGTARFRTMSTILQAGLILSLTTALLLLPNHSSQIGRRWLASRDAVATLLPPLWFVGLHETLAGSVIDGVVRRSPPRYVARQEEAATPFYRSLRPTFRRLGGLALVAWFGVALVTSAACAWNSRCLPIVARRSLARSGVVGRAWEWLVTRLVARGALQQAGFFFALQALSRRASYRVTMATSAAVALSLMIVVGFRPAPDASEVAPIGLGLLATQSLVIAVVLTGFRHATHLPPELRGGMTIDLAWPGTPTPFVAGVKRAGWMAVVLPALAFMWIWHAETLGPRVALLHLGVGLAVASLMMDVAFFHSRRVPLTSAYVPSPDARASAVLYGALVLTASLAVASVERASLEMPRLYIGLLTTLVAISACLRRFDRVSPTATIELDPDEAASLPTQRLRLGG